ncbi:MAG: DEAD/DEAH box helicase [Hyphomicrobiales bacterium]|nr:MAG: DEAD/DEAH box helicase [Hyphomicrobiales bacterium]
MMATLEEKQTRVSEATQSGFRERLLSRGQARSIIWKDGLLPENAPNFSPLLSYDLLSYGYSLISDGLDIIQENGDANIARKAFQHGAGAIESVVAKGAIDPEHDFHRFIAAAGYHLGRFSARAYSLLSNRMDDENLTVSERCLSLLMMRDLDALEQQIIDFKHQGNGSDDVLARQLFEAQKKLIDDDEEEDEESDSVFRVLDLALTDGFVSALGTAMLAFERGDEHLLESALEQLKKGLKICSDLSFVPQWWCHRLAIYLLADLWNCSFHSRLPLAPLNPEIGDWLDLREIFIASLYSRSRSEIELWPSQLSAAARAMDVTESMVVSLPTSAGKTRIAELCILACLALGKRVLFITPLRALSAQTETTLERTFTPLGKTVSSLYGSIGVSGVDNAFLNERDIIVATPEKLDFALRNDPDILNDVGLIVLDEGHMIGIGEREIRYEVQIQKLLHREDAKQRRIICLSAILPADDKLEDFVGWLTSDGDNGLIQMDWRPTGLRFGEVAWQGKHARLQFSVGDERPFVPQYLDQVMPTAAAGKRRLAFPNNQNELCLATTWRLLEDDQTVLIFCPLRKSVESFAKTIVDLHSRGFLDSVLAVDEAVLHSALTIGAEWFPKDNAILKCLKLGVAIHHGSLPTPYRREVEKLLREGVLKVTVSSPTLAQGLNLSATALVFHGLYRNGELIKISEFRNVVGRAGRAYIDVEGLVLYPMFDKVGKRRAEWNEFTGDFGGKEMESGLLLLVEYLLARMYKKCNATNPANLIEYIANAQCWDFPDLPGERKRQKQTAQKLWPTYISSLDSAILGLIGERDFPDEDIEKHLDLILNSSLWARRLAKYDAPFRGVLKEGLIQRSRFVWKNSTAIQRKAYFLAGVGLETGQLLDQNSKVLNFHLVRANHSLQHGSFDEAIESITQFAEILFTISPFTPKDQPENWRDVLAAWLKGGDISELVGSDDPEILKFIEEGLIYKLPWGMEAVRVRGTAHEDVIVDNFTMADYELGTAVVAVETGTLNVSAAVLMKAGFSSRSGSILAVTKGNADFSTLKEMADWLETELMQELSKNENWPTVETHELWMKFVANHQAGNGQSWKKIYNNIAVSWSNKNPPMSGTIVRLATNGDETIVLRPDFEPIGILKKRIRVNLVGYCRATVAENNMTVDVTFLGPMKL